MEKKSQILPVTILDLIAVSSLCRPREVLQVVSTKIHYNVPIHFLCALIRVRLNGDERLLAALTGHIWESTAEYQKPLRWKRRTRAADISCTLLLDYTDKTWSEQMLSEERGTRHFVLE